ANYFMHFASVSQRIPLVRLRFMFSAHFGSNSIYAKVDPGSIWQMTSLDAPDLTSPLTATPLTMPARLSEPLLLMVRPISADTTTQMPPTTRGSSLLHRPSRAAGDVLIASTRFATSSLTS